MLDNNLTSTPCYQKISRVEAMATQAKSIFINRPKATLLTGIALIALGSTAIGIGTASFLFPPISIGLITGGSAITAIGTSLLLMTCVKWKHVLAYLFAVPLLKSFGIHWTSKIDPNRFEDRNCSFNNKLIGKVEHEQGMPVLELLTEDNYEMGLAQGYLLGEQIQEAFDQVMTPMMSLCGTLTGDFSGKFFSRQASQVKIPDAYRREIEGLVTGVHQWAKQKGVSSTLTVEHALNAHKLTDIYKAIGCQRLLGIRGFNAFGCSTAVVKKGDEVAVGRTLDWPSFGKMGELAFIRRHKVNGKQIEMQSFAGIIGAHTACNEDGLVAIINENGTVTKPGIPYAMLARQIIEQASNVSEAEEMMNKKEFEPASSHHLTLADTRQAAIYQIPLNNERKFIKRELDFGKEKDFIVVTNHTTNERNEILKDTICDGSSKARYNAMTETIAKELQTNRSIDDVVKKSLQSVNVLDTVATARFKLTHRERKPEVHYTNNNYWAAK